MASFFRTVRAMLVSYKALVNHFKSVMIDPLRKGNHSVFKGLYNMLTSHQFLLDLCMMFDILCEKKKKKKERIFPLHHSFHIACVV